MLFKSNFTRTEQSTPKHVRRQKRSRLDRSSHRSPKIESLESRALLAAVAVPEGLISWWTGDATADDLTGRNNADSLNGASVGSGMVGNAFNFDGIDDIVLAPTSGMAIGSADRTIELWAHIDQFNSDGAGSLLASYGTAGVYSSVYSLTVKSDGRAFISTWGRDVIGSVLEIGRWYHLAATNEGRSFKLYVDGSLVGAGELDVDTPTGSDLKIGRQIGNNNRLHGAVDEVSVYDRALSQSELQAIYNAGSDGKFKGSYITADFPTVVEGSADSLVNFTIRRVGSLVGEAVVHWETLDGSATAEGANADYVSASDTIVFADGESQKTVSVTVKGDTIPEPDETFQFLISTATPGYAVLNGHATIVTDDPITKYFVVNDGPSSQTDETYGYQGSGESIFSSGLSTDNNSPRGAASTAAGDKVWVVDANKKVYVYDAGGTLLGSWSAGSLTGAPQVEGIATDGTDVWIVDAKQDKVFRYANAASRLSGSQNAAASFGLNKSNKSPKDVVTDGTHLWVVDDSTTDKVFKYTLTGSLVASWTISTSYATSPTGITLDPSNPAHLWIVDNGTDTVYEYANAVNQANGSSKSANANFLLAPGNTNPQGIADPPVVGEDRISFPNDQPPQPVGDSNRDGIFNSADLVLDFQAGEYEDDVAGNSTFEEGDWNGDGEFNSRDLVFAFQQGKYVSATVPESWFSQDSRGRRRVEKIVRGDYGPLDSLFAELL